MNKMTVTAIAADADRRFARSVAPVSLAIQGSGVPTGTRPGLGDSRLRTFLADIAPTDPDSVVTGILMV
jgi:hypothetical protein